MPGAWKRWCRRRAVVRTRDGARPMQVYGRTWEADANAAQALMLGGSRPVRRKLRQHIGAPRHSAARRCRTFPKFDFPPPPEQIIRHADNSVLSIARNEAKQGRLSEAEADARRALLENLKTRGQVQSVDAPNLSSGSPASWSRRAVIRKPRSCARCALDVQQHDRHRRRCARERRHPVATRQYSRLAAQDQGCRRRLCATGQGDRAMDAAAARGVRTQRLAHRRALCVRPDRRRESRQPRHWSNAKSRAPARTASTPPRRTARSRSAMRAPGATPTPIREFKTAIPVLMAAARENSEDDDPTVVPRAAPGCSESSKPISACWRAARRRRTTSRSRPSRSPTPSAATRCSRRWQIRARAWWPRIRRSPSSYATNRISPSRSTPSSACSTICWHYPRISATTRRCARSMPQIEKLRAERKTARQRDQAAIPGLCRSDRSEAADGRRDQGGAAARRGDAVILFRPGRELRLGGAQGRRRCLCRRCRRPRSSLKPKSASCARRSSPDHDGARKSRRSISRSPMSSIRALLKPVEAGWQAAKEPDRRDQRRARRISARLAADRAVADRCRRQAAIRRLSRCAVARPQPRRDRGAFGLGAGDIAAPAAGRANRDKLIGFGDPYFNAQEAAEAEAKTAAPTQVASAPRRYRRRGSTVTRGIPLKLRASPHTEDVDKAELAMLPRLPDTRAGINRDGQGARCRSRQGALSRQGRQRAECRDHRSVALPHRRLRHPRPGSRRPRWADPTGTGADARPTLPE